MRWFQLTCILVTLLTSTELSFATSSTEKKVSHPAPRAVASPKPSMKYTPITRNMWVIIASNFSLPHSADSADVQKQIKWFQTHPKYFNRIATQGQPYIEYIYREVKKRGLPGELVLLPMIESAYDPFAYSWVGAAGLWQMMPATGANFGLKQDWWYDGRKDIISSTKAALDYLSYLETFFNGNWPLAIAAYNSGEGTVQHAIDRNAQKGLSTDFESLRLPVETENYVPRLLALAAIIANPAKYQVVLPPLNSGDYFSVVSLKQQIDLSKAAKLANIKLSILYELNPGYSRWATDPKGPYRLVLPITAIPTFEAAYATQFGQQSLISTSHQTTQAVLSNNSTQAPIQHLEQNIVKATPINLAKATTQAPSVTAATTVSSPKPTDAVSPAPDAVKIPTPASNGSMSSTIVSTAPTATAKSGVIPLGSATTTIYTVKHGDTLWNIAKRFNVTVGQLRTWNKLSERQKVHVGQKLNIEQVKAAK